ncbi:hypothetical protein [Streptomyces sp. HUAS TT7]|uniref:hypothetical protein n=1 Tax=Streptomyces sp. HUAS TT7 TaxID=3447507 RepID=UPI003F65667A
MSGSVDEATRWGAVDGVAPGAWSQVSDGSCTVAAALGVGWSAASRSGMAWAAVAGEVVSSSAAVL